MKTYVLFGFLIALFLGAGAQNGSVKSFPKNKIWVYTRDGNLIKGFLAGTSDSSVTIFTGNADQWKHYEKTSLITESYSDIMKIRIHKKEGFIKGILLGAAI